MTEDQIRNLRPGDIVWMGVWSPGLNPSVTSERFVRQVPHCDYDRNKGNLYVLGNGMEVFASAIHTTEDEAFRHVLTLIENHIGQLETLLKETLDRRQSAIQK